MKLPLALKGLRGHWKGSKDLVQCFVDYMGPDVETFSGVFL